MVNLKDLFITFLKLGLTAFGGPAMVAYIKKLAVDKKQWLDEKNWQSREQRLCRLQPMWDLK